MWYHMTHKLVKFFFFVYENSLTLEIAFAVSMDAVALLLTTVFTLTSSSSSAVFCACLAFRTESEREYLIIQKKVSDYEQKMQYSGKCSTCIVPSMLIGLSREKILVPC